MIRVEKKGIINRAQNSSRIIKLSQRLKKKVQLQRSFCSSLTGVSLILNVGWNLSTIPFLINFILWKITGFKLFFYNRKKSGLSKTNNCLPNKLQYNKLNLFITLFWNLSQEGIQGVLLSLAAILAVSGASFERGKGLPIARFRFSTLMISWWNMKIIQIKGFIYNTALKSTGKKFRNPGWTFRFSDRMRLSTSAINIKSGLALKK